MSIDNLNAEHRGQFNVLPPSLRRRQCCSFCRQPGHNLQTCNSDRLREFEVICATQVLQTNTQDDFKNWLNQNYMSEQLLIKAFAVKKFRITIRTSIERCVDLTAEYIFMIYKNTNEPVEIVEHENEFENDLMTFIQALSNERQEEIQEEILEERRLSEHQQNIVMENMLMREMFIAMMSRIINRTSREENHKFKIVSTINENDNKNIDQLCECSICYDNKELKNFVKLTCNHEFCKECIVETMKISQNNKLCCALCRGEVKTIESRTNAIGNEISVYIE
jgi:hypothetical protein